MRITKLQFRRGNVRRPDVKPRRRDARTSMEDARTMRSACDARLARKGDA